MTRKERSQRSFTGEEYRGMISLRERAERAILVVAGIRRGEHPEHNPLRQRTLLLSAAGDLAEHAIALSAMNRKLSALLEEVLSADTPNASLPWTKDEDRALVDWRADGTPLHRIAANLGRTPAACATRLSGLVGIPRSAIIEGYLSGVLEGEQVRGEFHGQIRRFG
jgi:hypothetical protein